MGGRLAHVGAVVAVSLWAFAALAQEDAGNPTRAAADQDGGVAPGVEEEGGPGGPDLVGEPAVPDAGYQDATDLFKAVGLGNSPDVQRFQVRVNNRKILELVLSAAGIDNTDKQKWVLRVIDKLLKIGEENVRLELGPGRMDDSGDKIRFFFEEAAFAPDGNLGQSKERSINKIGHALHDLDPVFSHFSRSPKLAAFCADLGYKWPLLLQSMYIFKQPGIGGEVTCHQDATFLYTEPASVTGFWFALEDATRENGCMWAAPGAHKLGLKKRFVRAAEGGTPRLCRIRRLRQGAFADRPPAAHSAECDPDPTHRLRHRREL